MGVDRPNHVDPLQQNSLLVKTPVCGQDGEEPDFAEENGAHAQCATDRLRPCLHPVTPVSTSSRLDTPGSHFVNRRLENCIVPACAALHCAQKSRTHSSAGERSLHTGEVQGSIPCASTRSAHENKDLRRSPGAALLIVEWGERSG